MSENQVIWQRPPEYLISAAIQAEKIESVVGSVEIICVGDVVLGDPNPPTN